MRDKIIAAFKAKYSNVTLSQKRLDALADKLAPKITEETQIEAKLEELNEIFSFADIQKEDDRIRTLESQVKKQEKKEEPKKEPKKEPEEPEEYEMPAWAKALLDKVTKLEAEKQQSTIKQKLAEKLKDVPSALWAKRIQPEKEEDIDAFVADVENDYNTLPQLAVNSKPKSGTGKVDKTASKEEIDSVLDKIKF